VHHRVQGAPAQTLHGSCSWHFVQHDLAMAGAGVGDPKRNSCNAERTEAHSELQVERRSTMLVESRVANGPTPTLWWNRAPTRGQPRSTSRIRTWAIESADGLGKLLSQQLVAAGEHVVDVPPILAARVRLLGSTKAAKNDGNDALSTAIAGLRHCELRTVRRDDHSTLLRLLVGRYDDLVSLRTQAACRPHAVLRELVAGGAPLRLSADRAAKLLRGVHPDGLVAGERKRLAGDLLADVPRLDRELAAIKIRIRQAVDTSGTTLLELHGVGPIVAGLILAHVGDPARFATPERFASYNHRSDRGIEQAA
jgi:transposase